MEHILLQMQQILLQLQQKNGMKIDKQVAIFVTVVANFACHVATFATKI